MSIAEIATASRKLRAKPYRSASAETAEYLQSRSVRLRADIAKLESEYRINQRLLELRRREP